MYFDVSLIVQICLYFYIFAICNLYYMLFFLLQVVLISATLPNEILEITSKFMTDPVRILVKRDELTLEVINGFSLISAFCEKQYEIFISIFFLVLDVVHF